MAEYVLVATARAHEGIIAGFVSGTGTRFGYKATEEAKRPLSLSKGSNIGHYNAKFH